MDTTPKRLVHWALDISFSGLGSPFSEGTSTEFTSTSSLQYANSQLIAHGFTDIELSLDGLGTKDAERVVKCLFSMLSQRVDDMSRTEELTTKLRTLSYDHERMVSKYRVAEERAANAEREMNVHKSRLGAATRSLQAAENAHRQTTAELQRTRTALQALRTAHQTEIKKLEKEKERMTDRWSKVCDTQVKLGSTSSSLRCANTDVVEASDIQPRGKTQGFLDIALEQTEQARRDLFERNRKLRGLILSAANDLQGMIHAARNDGREEPAPLTSATLFPLSPTKTASDKLSSLLTSVREIIGRLSNPNPDTLTPHTLSSSQVTNTKPQDASEIDRLQAVIETLRKELEEAQKQASTYAAQTQALFDRFAEEEKPQGDVGEMSVDLMTAPARDEEKRRLDTRFKELEQERQKFTEAAVRLGREKAALEAERLTFLEEKRAWQVQVMLTDLPPTPVPPAVETVPSQEEGQEHAVRSPPRKLKATSIPSGRIGARKPRSSRRSSGFGLGLGPVSSKRIVPPFETEVIPSPKVQPPAFVLPPPSPAASLPTNSGVSSSLIPLPTQAEQTEPSQSATSTTTSNNQINAAYTQPSSTSAQAPQSSSQASAGPSSAPAPKTPETRRPFPMAKPLAAAHMIHAYSPVKPSPLSRILMLAKSPDSPESDSGKLNALQESDSDFSPTPMPIAAAPLARAPIQSLAELGALEDPDENPLLDKTPDAKGVKPRASQFQTRLTAKQKGKGRAEPLVHSRSRPAVALERENIKRAKLISASTANRSPFARTKAASKLPGVKGGARRVPIGSAEAAPTGPTWKG
ncbi:uncharacterized protein LAESUDRAFT_742987 [Laetiporus sulphureus 93-53]|uniref:Afadin and alpha-actinin-binding-domain-containing protein n=1 Tax=Laetiporus sulphureus 93-53 TaxID=1314785 RepID=A0A165EKF9_9APHY|nr:uncharacterized protein LAESUDRAFT_742987 [Laetiporus sulphureus 93-53]KZT07244.1 hypothetical protein LAESUDRAFT_742987 [Laetiporus sulphureus 93-53]